jgi:hypothetical protein
MTSFGNSTLAIVDSAVPIKPNALICLSHCSTRAPAKKAEVWKTRHVGQGSHGRRGNLPLRPLPGSQSRETHQRGQPLQSEARNAKNAPESAICGVLPNRLATTGSMLCLVPISNPRSAPRGVGRTNLRSDASRLWRSPPPCGSPPPHPSRKRRHTIAEATRANTMGTRSVTRESENRPPCTLRPVAPESAGGPDHPEEFITGADQEVVKLLQGLMVALP